MLDDVSERPKIADAPLSVVLLAPPDATDLAFVVQAWHAWLGQRPGAAEVLLVLENGGHYCLSASTRVIHHLAPPGVGPALQSAISLVQHPLVLIAPCDRQFQPADAARLFEFIDKVDLVAGIRVQGPPPWWLRTLDLSKRILTRVLLGYADEPCPAWLGWRGWTRRLLARRIFGVKLRDPECVVRLGRTETLRRFPLQARGNFVHVEIIAKTNHLGCWMAEVPLPWTPPENETPDPWWADDRSRVFRQPEFYPDSVDSRSCERTDVAASC